MNVQNEWFDRPDPTGRTSTGEVGLRFECTMCGNCCTGPEGYVLFTDVEADALAARLGITRSEFLDQYTQETSLGPSIKERKTDHGFDCVFLDREKIPGRAVCGVYEDRPTQCRTWPFWRTTLRSRSAWDAARRTCPGLDQGPLHAPAHIRLTRNRVDI